MRKLTEEGELRPRTLSLPGDPVALDLLRPPSVDELLERLDPDEDAAEERIPYWAEHWPSADALLHWLAEGKGPRHPGRALELGCGLGILGMAALRRGWDIRLSDRDPEALDLLRINLARNGLDPDRAFRLDWRDPPPERYDTILAADVLYERSFAEPIADFMDRALAIEGKAYIAEPGRPVAESALELFAKRFHLKTESLEAMIGEKSRPVRILVLSRRGSR